MEDHFFSTLYNQEEKFNNESYHVAQHKLLAQKLFANDFLLPTLAKISEEKQQDPVNKKCFVNPTSFYKLVVMDDMKSLIRHIKLVISKSL